MIWPYRIFSVLKENVDVTGTDLVSLTRASSAKALCDTFPHRHFHPTSGGVPEPLLFRLLLRF